MTTNDDRGLVPRVHTQHRASRADLERFDRGFELLGYNLRGRGVLAQQRRVVDALTAGRRFAAVLMPRQSAKTTSIETLLIGLCQTIPGLRVAYALGSTGQSAWSHYLKAVAGPLEARYPDRRTRPIAILRGNGASRVEWPGTGSAFVVAQSPDYLRGDSFDVVWIDEGGELDALRGADWLTSAQPTQDTRVNLHPEFPQPLLVISGTAAKMRDGSPLWDFLQLGRTGDPDVSILEYSAGVNLVPEDYETWELAEPLVLASHPGVQPGNLTTLATIRGNYRTMDRERFGRDYLGIFADETGTRGVIAPSKWEDGLLGEEMPTLPDDAALGIATHVNQSSAGAVAAWRTPEGDARLAVVDYRDGTSWLPEFVREFAARRRRTPIAHDTKGPILVEVERARKAAPRAPFAPQTYRGAQQAAQLLVREVHRGALGHYGQDALTAAALAAVKRGDEGWLFGRPRGVESDICLLEAASLALKIYDEQPRRAPLPRGVLPAA